MFLSRYELDKLREWVEIRLVDLLAKENLARVFSLAWKYDSEVLIHGCFKKFKTTDLDEVKTTREWKDVFEGKEPFFTDLIEKF